MEKLFQNRRVDNDRHNSASKPDNLRLGAPWSPTGKERKLRHEVEFRARLGIRARGDQSSAGITLSTVVDSRRQLASVTGISSFALALRRATQRRCDHKVAAMSKFSEGSAVK
jgi:hypothetical protein